MFTILNLCSCCPPRFMNKQQRKANQAQPHQLNWNDVCLYNLPQEESVKLNVTLSIAVKYFQWIHHIALWRQLGQSNKTKSIKQKETLKAPTTLTKSAKVKLKGNHFNEILVRRNQRQKFQRVEVAITVDDFYYKYKKKHCHRRIDLRSMSFIYECVYVLMKLSSFTTQTRQKNVPSELLWIDVPAMQRNRLSSGSSGTTQGLHIFPFRLF